MTKYQVILAFGILSALASCTEIPTITPNQILDLEILTAGPYSADGTSSIQLVVAVPKEADEAYKTVTLSTRAGKFSNNDTIIAISLKAEAVDTVALVLGTTEGMFQINAKIGSTTTFTAQANITLLPLRANQIFREIEFAGLDTLIADGVSEVVFRIALGVKSAVKFSSESGSFRQFGGTSSTSLTMVPDLQNNMTVIFTMGRSVKPAFIQLESALPLYDSLIRFQPRQAFADQLVLNVATSQLDSAGDHVNVSAIVGRNTGMVTPGTDVTFFARVKSSEDTIGYFSSALVKSSDNETAATTFVFEGVPHLTAGEIVEIHANTKSSNGATLDQKISLIVKGKK